MADDDVVKKAAFKFDCQCPKCGTMLAVNTKQIGKTGVCPTCKARVLISAPANLEELIAEKSRQKKTKLAIVGVLLSFVIGIFGYKYFPVIFNELDVYWEKMKQEAAERRERERIREQIEAERREEERREAKRREEERRRREAERKEAERIEAERKEAERKETERREAERREAERRERELEKTEGKQFQITIHSKFDDYGKWDYNCHYAVYINGKEVRSSNSQSKIHTMKVRAKFGDTIRVVAEPKNEFGAIFDPVEGECTYGRQNSLTFNGINFKDDTDRRWNGSEWVQAATPTD